MGPQTHVWKPHHEHMKNSSNYISVQKLKTENNNKYLSPALCCEGPPSLHVAFNKWNIKKGHTDLVVVKWEAICFHASWRGAFRTEVAVNKAQVILVQDYWDTTGHLKFMLSAAEGYCSQLWDRSGLKRLGSTSWPEKAAVTPLQYVCFHCSHSNQYCPRCCWLSQSAFLKVP